MQISYELGVVNNNIGTDEGEGERRGRLAQKRVHVLTLTLSLLFTVKSVSPYHPALKPCLDNVECI